MGRIWLLTSTTYGTWLPGDERGSVTRVRDGHGPRIEHDAPGTDCDGPMPGLQRSAVSLLKGDPIFFTQQQAEAVAAQFKETAAYRKWSFLAFAIMRNHFHLLVAVPGDPDPSDVLGDFKSYASRALNRRYGKPSSGTWWTGKGSMRKKPDERAVLAAVEYVRGQPGAWVIFVDDDAVAAAVRDELWR
jgi:REP element-mobilizing transposase RayT